MSNKIKLLFYGDSPTASTGFGTVSKNILTGLHRTNKYDITVLGINMWGEPHKFPFPIWPMAVGSADPYGRQKALDMMASPEFQFDVLFMIQDSFILEFMNNAIKPLKAAKDFTSVCYYPVDGVPRKSWIESMASFDVPVTYTEFARSESILAHPGIADRLQVIPHGTDSKSFFPVSDAEVAAFRNSYFGPFADRFIVTNVNRNQQRKDIPRSIMVFKEFKKLRPSSVLYLHCAPVDQGWDLNHLVVALGLKPGEDVIYPNKDFTTHRGYPIEVLNLIYNASDVVMSTTLGEGWGLSSTEAMAAKVPVLFPRNTSLTEIVGEDRGFLANSGASADHFVCVPSDNEVIRPLTDVRDMAEKLLFIHDNPDEANRRVENAYKWVTTQLDWQKNIVPKWDSLIQDAVASSIKKKLDKKGPAVVSSEEF